MTLIEVIIALGLLVVILLALAGALNSAQTAVSLTTERQAVSHEAFRRLDLVLATPYDDVVALWDDATFDVTHSEVGAAFLPSVALAATGATKAGRVQITVDPGGDGSTDLMEARVTVDWRDMLGDDRTLEAIGRKTR